MSSQVGSVKVSNAIEYTIIGVIVLVVAIVIIMVAKGSKILGSVGDAVGGVASGVGEIFEAANIINTKTEKEDIKALEERIAALRKLASEKNPFNPNFYKLNGGDIITTNGANEAADQIWSGVGAIYDDPSVIVGTIKRYCKTKSAVSFVADRFYVRHGNDLLNWLYRKLDTAEQKQSLLDIIQYVDALPATKIKK